MKIYTVILIRDPLEEVNEYRPLQHLQYAAGPFEANDEYQAVESAIKELQEFDKELKSGYDSKRPIVLGVFEDGTYKPWLNGGKP